MIFKKKHMMAAFLMLIFSPFSNAACSGVLGRTITGYDYDTASIGVGRINIISNYLQPIGTTLAVGISNYNTIRKGGLSNLSDNDVVLTCTSQSDKNNLAWAFATNGDSRIGGFYEIPGYPGYYATQFPYVAIKLSFADTGEVFSRQWKKSSVPVETENTSNGGFVIRKKHIPKVIASLVKWSQPYGQSIDANGIKVSNTYCHGAAKEDFIPTSQTSNPNQVWTSDYYSVNGLAAGCGQPNGYINLLGTGGYQVNVGTDSNSDVWAWDYSIPIGLNGSPAATFSYTPGCVVKTVNPYVVFPTMTISQLNSGETVSRNFDITLECDNTINKSVSSTSVSVGLQPSISAFNNAKTLGLLDPVTGGVKYLVSDNYTDSNMAKGVGITLTNADGNNVNFVSWDGCVPTTTSNSSFCPSFSSIELLRSAGWDPVMSASTQISTDFTNGTTIYRKTYVSTLGKINNMTPSIGKIKATATVLIRYP